MPFILSPKLASTFSKFSKKTPQKNREDSQRWHSYWIQFA